MMIRSDNTQITPEFEEYYKNKKPQYLQMKSIYILSKEDGFVKIGSSNDVKTRISSIRSSTLSKIDVWYSSAEYTNYTDIMRLWMDKYEHFRVRGNWFSISYDDGLKYLKYLCNKIGNANKIIKNKKPSSFEIMSFNWFRDMFDGVGTISAYKNQQCSNES